MTEEDIRQEFRMKKMKEIHDYFIKEIDQNKLLSNKIKKIYTTLNYIEHLFNFIFAVTVYLSISAFASLIDISMGIMGFTIALNICARITKTKKYKSIL